MRAVVVHSRRSACRCHDAVARALRPRGWRVAFVVAEDLPARLAELRDADAVFEHTDVLRRDPWLRAIVRAEAERVGAPVVGSPAAVAALCDDKAAAGEALVAAGVPVPETAVVCRAPVRLPRSLRGPFVVKGAFDHGSRTLVAAETRADARAAAAALVARGRPALVQRRIDGRELAVALAGRPLRALPAVEILLPEDGGRPGLYTQAAKWGVTSGRNGRIVPAELPRGVAREVARTALRAARTLGVTGYGRVDLRLAADGTPWVLEVNARPSLEPGMELATAAEAGGEGLAALLDRLACAAAARRPR